MATVIPKLTVAPTPLHHARRKLQTKQVGELTYFSAAEREALLALIQRGKRQLYPSQTAIENYQFSLHEIARIDRDIYPARFDHYAGKIEAFEQKYCR